MLPRSLASFAALALFCLPVRALNVSGNVYDKSDTPLWNAKVCVTSEPANCVNTDIAGAFHIQGALGIRGSAAPASPYRMELRNGMLSLTSPSAQKVRLEWLTPGGRALARPRILELGRGRNSLSLPAGLPENGTCLIRLGTDDLTLTWKAVWTGSQGEASARKSPARITALSKVATAGTLLVTKAGYKPRIYAPAKDPETGGYIILSTTADVGLNYTAVSKSKVLSINRPSTRIITQSVFPYCDSTGLALDTSVDTSFYLFRGGRFWLWYKGDCAAQSFTGTGTDPVGTWSLFDPSAELSSELKTGCVPDTTDQNPPFDTYTSTLTVSESELNVTANIEFCAGDAFTYPIALLFGDPDLSPGKNTCKQTVINNAKNLPATLDFSKRGGDSILVSFTYRSSICSFIQPMHFDGKDPVCPEDDFLTPFVVCLASSGFSDSLTLGGLLGKAAAAPAAPIALPMSLETRVRGLLPVRAGIRPRARFSAPAASPERGSIFPMHGWLPKSAP